MDFETWVWIIFFVIIGLLRLIGWFMQQVRGPVGPGPRQPGQRPPSQRPPSGPRGAPRQETPFQSVLRMLEEAAEQQKPPQQPPSAPQVRQRVRPRAQPQPVPRAKKVPDTNLAGHHLHSQVAGRHLKGKVAQQHLRSRIGDRSLGSLMGATDDRAAARARRDVKRVKNFWERLDDYSPAQRAIILAEVVGPPKASHMLRSSRSRPLR